MSRIAIIGPGAIGGVVAAWLAQRHEITLCARTPLRDLEVTTPDGKLSATPRILTDPADATPHDWVLVATKTYDVDSTRKWLGRLVNDTTRLAILQNGVEHIERFRSMLPEDRIVPVVVDIPAARTAPGRMVQHQYGTMFVPDGPNGGDYVALFEGSKIAVATDPDWPSRAWAKLCLNAAGAVPALTLASTGPAWTPALEAIIRAIVEECAAVGRAEGARIGPEIVESVIDKARRSRPEDVNSLQADRIAGRPMEIDARNGVIVRLGAIHGIATPVSAMIVALLEATRKPS